MTIFTTMCDLSVFITYTVVGYTLPYVYTHPTNDARVIRIADMHAYIAIYSSAIIYTYH
jgi:hypothetical protein